MRLKHTTKRLLGIAVAALAATVSSHAVSGAGVSIDASGALALGGASGGDEIKRIDNADGTFDIVHFFTNTTTSTFAVPAQNNIQSGTMRALVVAGGGSGGAAMAGGGGGGGVVKLDSIEIASGGSATVTVGAGAAAKTPTGTGSNTNTQPGGLRGGNSVLAIAGGDTTTAYGGGGGKGWAQDGQGSSPFGSTGGGSGARTAAGTGSTSGQGSAGGTGLTGTSSNGAGGGGGGGAAEAGGNCTRTESYVTGGKGGDGVESDISGEVLYYGAGGGGGAAYSNSSAGGAGGKSGDGTGTWGSGANRYMTPGNTSSGVGVPVAGQDGFGGGGGGGTYTYNSALAGNLEGMGAKGGSGVVIIRYKVGTPLDDGSTLYTFTDDAEFQLPKAALARVLAVGGGGAGGSGSLPANSTPGNGGGGAGRFIDGTNILFAVAYDIDVGAGGTNAVGTTASTPGGDGQPTVISTNGVNVIYMPGGGGGGVNGTIAGRAGGSSGGASKNGTSANPVSTYGGLGNKGGTSTYNRTGGGGGGAGGIGGNASSTTVAGEGGLGIESDITGSPEIYAAGGGGGARTGTGGAGGSGIGGAGGGSSAGSKGKDGTGSGGGGGGNGNAAGAGGSGVVIIRVVRFMPDKPEDDQSFPYDGDDHTIAFEDEAVEISGTVSASAAGTYTTTFTLKEIGGIKYVWSDGTSGAITRTWSITPPELVIDSFSLEGWQTGEAPSKPVIVSTPVVMDGEVVYYYSSSADGPWADTTPPDSAGTWYAKAVIDSANFTHDHANDPVASFRLWDWEDRFPEYAAYHADITDARYTGASTLENFPVLVRVDSASLPQFYAQCRADGGDVRFTDADGNPLPFEPNVWNPDGESSWWVKAPEYKQGGYVATINWGVVVDADGNEVEMPENDPTQVWSEYIAVWHLSGMEDATGHGYGLSGDTGNAEAAADSVFGAATYVNGSAKFLKAGGYEAAYPGAASNFTFTAWYKAQGYSGNMNFAGKRDMLSIAAGGWHLRMEEGVATSVRFIASDASKYWTMKNLPSMKENWNFFAIASSPENLKVLVNDETRVDTSDATHLVSFNEALLTVASSLMAADEVRIAAGQRSADWMKAEYQQADSGAAGGGFVFGDIYATPDVSLKNRWVVLPTVTPDAWPEGTRGVVGAGQASYGTVRWTFTNTKTGETLENGVPDAAGDWHAVFFVDGGVSGTRTWNALEYDFGGVSVYKDFPYVDLSGGCGSQTASGRVLLANDDTNGESPVEGQSYWLTNANESATFWVHTNETAITLFRHMTIETEHTLCSGNPVDELCGGTLLWRLFDARIGNVYPAEAANYASYRGRVYLPQSGTAGAFTSSGALPGLAESAHIALRNLESAAIYSPCYTNGVGTIYFDAANAETSETGEGYGICVEIATVATNTYDAAGNFYETAPATDEFVHEIVQAYDEETQDEDGNDTTLHHDAETNLYACAKWETPKRIIVLKRDGTEEFEKEEISSGVVQLAISNGGTLDNFYRIIVPDLDIRGPVRFRIRRAERNATYGNAPDGPAFILVDNIAVSYPAMKVNLEPKGKFDYERSGKEALGWENAFSVPFPSISGEDVLARAATSAMVNPGNPSADPAEFAVSATLHYRWRYLGQKFVPEDGWREVRLPPGANYIAEKPLELPAGVPGDVEFWYETMQNAPYYKYHDFSGLGLGVPGYTEEIQYVTNAYWNTETDVRSLETTGTNWFIRLREGRSAFEGINILVKEVDSEGTEGAVQTIPMSLSADETWRAFVKTLKDSDESAAAKIMFRFEALNEQTAGSEDFAEGARYFAARESAAKLPVSSYIAETSDPDVWQSVPCDYATGYFLFQISTDSLALSVVHSDYQNFNSWNDAKGTVFVGTSTEDSSKSGASPRSVSHFEDFSAWGDMSRTNSYWEESFVNANPGSYAGKADYTPFSSWKTENAWQAGSGQWVNQYYRDTQLINGLVQRSFQMKGLGDGYLQFVNPDFSPRGLDTVSFTARIGQSINVENFSYYNGDAPISISNYTFFARAAFDLNSNKNFSGNATLSLIANYRPGTGFYEFRFEQEAAALNNAKTAVSGINTSGQYLKLYKWAYNSKGKLVATQLTGGTREKLKNPVNMPNATSLGGSYLPMFISVSNDVNSVMIMAGVRRTGVNDSATQSSQSSQSYAVLVYRDAQDPIRSGTYGLLSANCEGVFDYPYFYGNPAAINQTFTALNSLNWYSSATMTFSGSEKQCRSDINNGFWYIQPGRMESFDSSNTRWGVRASTPEEPLVISTAPSGTTDFSEIVVTNVASFGSAGKAGMQFAIPVRSTENCSVKISDGAEVDDVRNDIVIDDVVLTQWRGDDWNNTKNQSELSKIIPGWSSDDGGTEGHTNFLFTSAWITNHTVLLSARRTATNKVSSIRMPLFDGNFGRGKGLGMVAFEYENAQTNANLLLQIATNGVNYSNINTYDDWDALKWTTVTNFDFSAAAGLSDTDRRSGSRSCYLGLHDIAGVMRLVIDPEVVDAVKDSQDTTAFGEIYIKSVFCRDEPKLDMTCWWGWNLRTLGQDGQGEDSEGRMFLYDQSKDPSKVGLSLALNNSVSDGIDQTKSEEYRQHLPFLQTPTFGTNAVGEISFRARKYDTSAAQPAEVTLFGSTSGSIDGAWNKLKVFSVTNDTYSTYSYKTDPNEAYAAFRLAVTGVSGVTDTNMQNASPEGYDAPVRILLDEVAVFEAIYAKIGFLNVGTIRNNETLMMAIDSTAAAPGVPGEAWQPLCNESWGVQCEIYAAQLEDEIDFDRAGGPRVLLHWYNSDYPWGYDNWKNESNAKSAFLSPATGANNVYKSSYLTSPDAVIPLSTAPGQVVQYMLEVIYYTKESAQPLTNRLDRTEWQNPPWYAPIDKNAGAGSFSAYTILDSVAPHWAWINEVNIFSEYDSNYENADKKYQYVEIAVPQEADITGWHVDLLDPYENMGYTCTNVLGVFGSGIISGTKSLGAESNMTFRVLANEGAWKTGNLKYSDGTLDGVWDNSGNPAPTHVFTSAGEISAIDPIGLRLVRASGIVEHEIVVRGLDWFSQFDGDSDESEKYTNTVNYLNRISPTRGFFWVGDDDGGAANSLGVFTGSGMASNQWNDAMERTPGRINKGQVINPDHPTPNGSSILVYANVDNEFGHIRQTVGDAVETNASQIIVLKKGSEIGTNITYIVDAWYELGRVVTNGSAAAWTKLPDPATNKYVVTVGLMASNNITVNASAQIASSLVDLGLTADNEYTPAVMKWLETGTDAYGNPWENRGSGEVKLSQFIPCFKPEAAMDMTLTEMYWLDMDPTVGNLALVGGINHAAMPASSYGGSPDNIRLGVYMSISNRLTGANWKPYITRGIDYDMTSWDYKTYGGSWDSASFKIVGILLNGRTSIFDKRNRVPLRWFLFDENSFDENNTAMIDVANPLTPESPAYYQGFDKYPADTQIYYSFDLDGRQSLFSVEILNKESYLEY